MNVELNGDVRLSATDRVRYIVRNAARNIRSFFGSGPRSRAFAADAERASAIIVGQSPGRLLTELFIESEIPRIIPPRHLNVIEVGCGSGSMAYRLAQLGYSGHYTGIDIRNCFVRNQPNEFPFTVTFVAADAHEFASSEKFDLMISVSTLEHIPEDVALIEQFRSLFKVGGLEVHVVPSGVGLILYLWHGFRQYTPALLAMKFGPRVEVVRLGGLGSYLLHFVFISVPDLLFRCSLRNRWPGLYSWLLLGALRIDRIVPCFPSAYVVIRRH